MVNEPIGLLGRAGLTRRLVLDRRHDPLFEPLTGGVGVAPVPVADRPVDDNRSYHVDGKPGEWCRPYVRVVEERTGWLAGPQVRFEIRDDGTHLTVKLEESVEQRVPGAMPFDVRVTGVALSFGGGQQTLPFPTAVQTPGDDPATGPAFRVEADALVPPEVQEQLVADLAEHDRASWVVDMELDWIDPAPPASAGAVIDILQLSPQAPWQGSQLTDATGNSRDEVMLPFNGSDGDSNGFVILDDNAYCEDGSTRRALRTHPKWVDQGCIKGWHAAQLLPAGATFTAEVGFFAGATGTDGVDFVVFEHHDVNGLPTWSEVARLRKGYTGQLETLTADLSHLAGQQVGIELRCDAGPSSGQDWALWVAPRIEGATETVTSAGTPTVVTIERQWAAYYPDTGRNTPIYAAIHGDYASANWQSSPHGWFQPTALHDTVYCLPDAFRLHVDEVTGLPSVLAVLLRRQGADGDDLDASSYLTRLTLKATPDFDAGRLAALRTFIRAQSTNAIPYADLVVGGYSAARFVPDDSLAGLAELFAGRSAEERDVIDPATGFSITCEGGAEFIDLLWQRLQNEGIGGAVELDLNDPHGATRKVTIPVVLTLRRPAPLALPVRVDISAPGDGHAGRPTPCKLTNPTAREVSVAGLDATALQRSPITGRVAAWFPAAPVAPFDQLAIAPGQSATVKLKTTPPNAVWNTWDVALRAATPTWQSNLLLGELFDAATQGVRGWKISVDCPPLQFFDQLTDDEKASLSNVVGVQVQVRRVGRDDDIQEARLTRTQPQAFVLLSRTVADFLSDRATGRSTFEWRRRLLRASSADKWSDWAPETGSALSVYTK